MPVRMDTHQPEIDLTPGTTKSEIVCLLYENRGLGYRPSEVRDALEIPDGTATTTLSRLVDEGYVGKTADGLYYALDERDDLGRYAAARDQTERLFRSRDADAAATPDVESVVSDAELDELTAAAEDEFDL